MDPSLLRTVRAQPTAVTTLERALVSERIHSAYLFEGPDGVGKELAAFGFAQALVCERREGPLACGQCSACERARPRGERRVSAHPDVVVVGRGVYDPGQIGRKNAETQDISIDQVRAVVLARAAFPPHEGRARIFIVRAADELSVTAANALLKTLEEPNRATHFILLTSRPNALLATIRSRTLRVRFGPLPDRTVADLLRERGVDTALVEKVASIARGSMALALVLASPEESQDREAFLGNAIGAISARSLLEAFDVAEDAKKSKDRLEQRLLALAGNFRDEAIREPDSGLAARAARRFGLVLRAIRELDANGSPQLVTESLFVHLRAA